MRLRTKSGKVFTCTKVRCSDARQCSRRSRLGCCRYLLHKQLLAQETMLIGIGEAVEGAWGKARDSFSFATMGSAENGAGRH